MSLHTVVMGIRQRWLTTGSVPKLSEEQIAACKQAFADHPDWNDLYLHHDGKITGGEALRSKMTSRTAQLVSILTDGLPCNISRGHSQIRLMDPFIKYGEQYAVLN